MPSAQFMLQSLVLSASCSLVSDIKLEITTSTAMSSNTEYIVTIVGVGSYNKDDADKIPIRSDYVFKFHIGTFPASCVSLIASSGTFCDWVNGNSNLAEDGKYHCLKADLRVENTPNPKGK